MKGVDFQTQIADVRAEASLNTDMQAQATGQISVELPANRQVNFIAQGTLEVKNISYNIAEWSTRTDQEIINSFKQR